MLTTWWTQEPAPQETAEEVSAPSPAPTTGRWLDGVLAQPREARRRSIANLRAKHPGKVPVLFDRLPTCDVEPERHQVMFPVDESAGVLFNYIRRKCPALQPSEGMFFYVTAPDTGRPVMVTGSTLVSVLDRTYRHPELDALVVEFGVESTFG